jgi:hypothetical protein
MFSPRRILIRDYAKTYKASVSLRLETVHQFHLAGSGDLKTQCPKEIRNAWTA